MKFSPQEVAELLLAQAASPFRCGPIYGVFNGDVLVHWTCGRRKAREYAEEHGLHWQQIAKGRKQ